MSIRCPNCHTELSGARCSECGLTWKTKPDWVCSECGAEYYGDSNFLHCPSCVAKKVEMEKEYWADKARTAKVVTDSLVARILNGGG